MALIGALLLAAAAQDTRAPVPAAADQKRAEAEIRELFREDYAARRPDLRRAFAERLLAQAEGTKEDPVARFVLFREARDVAAGALDIATAYLAIRKMAGLYDVKAADLKTAAAAVARKGATTSEDAAALARSWLKVAGEAAKEADYETTARSVKEAELFAKPAKDASIASRVAEWNKELPELRKEQELATKAELTLSVNSNDPEACLHLGRYLCFAKGAWDQGLPLLARVADPAIKEAAARDLAKPQEPAAQADAGEAWGSLAEKSKIPIDKRRYQSRARHWYETALPELTGILRTKVEKKLDTLARAGSPEGVDLLKLIDPTKDAVNGIWAFEGSALTLPALGGARLQVPYIAPAEYDLKIVAERKAGDSALLIGLTMGPRQFMATLDAAGGRASHLENLDGAGMGNASTWNGRLFTDEKPKTILCSIRKGHVTITVEGKVIIDWKGDPNRLSMNPGWSVQSPKALLLGGWETRYLITTMTLTPVSGQGRLLR